MWQELALNPEVVRAIYGKEFPSLEHAEVSSIQLSRDGPTVTISFFPENYPGDPPAKYNERGHNATSITLTLSCVEKISIQGWGTENVMDLKVERIDDARLSFSGSNDRCKVEVEFGFLYIGISGYRDERRI